MKRLAAIALLSLAPGAAKAQERPLESPLPFANTWFARTLVGGGGVPNLPDDDRTGNVVLTAEVASHPIASPGGGALATGLSVSSTSDLWGHWSVVTPGVFAQIDLTYVLLSGLWAYVPPARFPFRLALGARLGLGISESWRPAQDVPNAAPYKLYRPELLSFFDVEVPLCPSHTYSLLARGAVDTSVNAGEAFRWSFSGGVAYSWSSW